VDIIKSADWVIDLGPEGGDAGGQIIAEGRPEQVMNNSASFTGRYLMRTLAAKCAY
jgi:excinuclease ABC subunit A